jgi:hypothetical protein
MEWLFGGDAVDLTSAQRAIDQLASDRDAMEDKVTKLGEILTQQRFVPTKHSTSMVCRTNQNLHPDIPDTYSPFWWYSVFFKIFVFRRKTQEAEKALEAARNEEKQYVHNLSLPMCAWCNHVTFWSCLRSHSHATFLIWYISAPNNTRRAMLMIEQADKLDVIREAEAKRLKARLAEACSIFNAQVWNIEESKIKNRKNRIKLHTPDCGVFLCFVSVCVHTCLEHGHGLYAVYAPWE